MSVFNKKVLSIIVYYTLVTLAIGAGAFFVFAVVINGLPLWAKIIYYAWVGLLIGAVVFDIICTCTHQAKTISGFIIYVLSVMAVTMTILLYLLNATTAGIDPAFMQTYMSTSILSLITTGYMIATWCVGESIVEHATANKEIADKA